MPGVSVYKFFSIGNFQSTRRIIYPSALNDVISHDGVECDWKALILENDFFWKKIEKAKEIKRRN